MKRTQITITIILLLAIGVIVFGIYQFYILRKAHSTFENYYAFRGCVQLLDRANDYGLCKIKSGETIKIVRHENKWYLDGDLPICWSKICF